MHEVREDPVSTIATVEKLGNTTVETLGQVPTDTKGTDALSGDVNSDNAVTVTLLDRHWISHPMVQHGNRSTN